MMLESIIQKFRKPAIALSLALTIGCTTLRQNPATDYIKECYDCAPDKLVTGITTPLILPASIVYYRFRENMKNCPGYDAHLHGSLWINSIPHATLLTLYSAYNLVAAPLPLPSATNLMSKTANRQGYHIQDAATSQELSFWLHPYDVRPNTRNFFRKFYDWTEDLTFSRMFKDDG